MKFFARLLPLLLVALVSATSAFAQNLPEVEVGYRWTDVTGNEDLYRTQINERDGFLIRSLTYFTTDFGHGTTDAIDHFRVDVTDLGSGPASAIRVETGKHDTYRLTMGYRSFESFSALPAFANPLLGQGIIPGQHTYDRDRTLFDADLELFPSSRFSPFIGFSRSTNRGPGTTTYTLGGDDFLLDSDLDETEREIRAGTAFNLGKFYGSVTQGWRKIESDETLVLHFGANSGNNGNTPVLGTPVTATAFERRGKTDVDAPFTNLYVAGQVVPRTTLIANYVRTDAEADSLESDLASGSFASFGLRRFFTGLTESTTSNAENKTWRGGLRAEVALTDKFDFMAGWQSEHRDIGGTALIESLYLNSITFGGADRRDFQEILEAESSVERKYNTFEAAIAARQLGPFAFRAGFTVQQQDYTFSPDLEEIVVPGNQGGDFERRVNTIDLNGSYTKSLFTVGAAWRRDSADEAVVRTDFLDRDRIRVRAGFHTPANFFRAAITAERVDQSNDDTGVDYDADSDQYTADVELAPLSSLRLRASYSNMQADTRILYRRPENFTTDVSRLEEDGDALEGGIDWTFKSFTLGASASRFENDGSLPFSFDRYRLRAVYDFLAHYGVAAEFARDNYEEVPSYGQYEADRFGIFLRYRP